MSKKDSEVKKDGFRDKISTVDKHGGRVWIYPKKVNGKYFKLRSGLSYVLLVVFFVIPFIKIKGDPLVLLNIVERKFILFSVVFTPQDMHLLALSMITFMLFIVLFTVVFGRLFCGWVCPQTIFLEMVFRKIEYAIEGDFNAQKRLHKAPWTSEKIFKKSLKHVVFFAISICIANLFLAYIIGVDELFKIIKDPINLHLYGFFALVLFSLLFYYIFAFFREQVCLVVCPYGRLQGVLLVKNSIVVIYDWIRGEPRGKLQKNRNSNRDAFVELPINNNVPQNGDCVDCDLCVKVCPTGIDIRNGTQLECINCTACMDACDEVMTKIGKPNGLIRYDSHSNIEEKTPKIFTARVWAYISVLSILIGLQSYLLIQRGDIELILLRTPGVMFQENSEGDISNLYNYQIINKTTNKIENLSFKLKNMDGEIKLVGQSIHDIEKQEIAKGSLFIEIDKDKLKSRSTKVIIDVYSDDKVIDKVKTTFLGPIK